MAARTRPRNDVRQYDDLVEQWSDPDGAFAMLFWLAAARAELVPPAPAAGAVLVDIACGGGLFAPHAARLGYRHVGVDLSRSALRVAADRDVLAVQGDVLRLPIRSGSADVVVAGEVLEHVRDLPGLVAEVCRALRPGGLMVIDTIAATTFGRLTSVTVGERIPGGPPPGIHDPALFVDRALLRGEFARHGVQIQLAGLRLPALSYLRWAWARFRRQFSRRPGERCSTPLPRVEFRSTRSTAGLFQGHGTKEASG
ncbi:MAG TPA: methyltransferase domain-containing protein [Frankiaceae bacterium]|nr:methyltransferase domain-containing protein [Frankiaceae bacterium]